MKLSVTVLACALVLAGSIDGAVINDAKPAVGAAGSVGKAAPGAAGTVVSAAAPASDPYDLEALTKLVSESSADSKKAGKLNVGLLTDEDNHPTPVGAKTPLQPPSHDIVDENAPEATSYNSFIMSISMIVVSEIGDKTFLIAALMAMKHSRYVVFSSAFVSLAIMTVLSGLVGHALPTLLSRRLTQFLASVLFIVFGFKLAKEGLAMSKDMGVEDELAEVEEEIEFSKLNTNMENIESGQNFKSKKEWYVEFGDQIRNLASFVLSPIWIQVFVMTFLGEWGDRSQIATIAMAAGSEYWFVILGAIIGHFLCTAAACIGGKLLAKKISMRNVTLGGAFAFFIFAILYFYNAYYDIED